jgi:feruloyl esterase
VKPAHVNVAKVHDCFTQTSLRDVTYSQLECREANMRSMIRVLRTSAGSLRWILSVLAILGVVICQDQVAKASGCKSLRGLTIPDVTIESAYQVPSGSLTLPGPRIDFTHLPEFCRVSAVATPSRDSMVRIEIWIPNVGKWSGRFQAVGNGGYSGDIDYRAMARALEMGDAAAGTDTGHSGGDLRFGAGHPERIIDWAYRAVHVMTETAKLTIRDYAGRFPDYSYFNGCSTGGGQGLAEAQRFPLDYDGILVGAPGNYRTSLNAGFLWAFLADHADAESGLTGDKLALLNKAAITACDATDGIRDGIINNPLQCHFDPGVLACRQGEDTNCLSKSQVQTARAIYRGPHAEGKQLFPGYEPGSEIVKGAPPAIGSWGAYLTGLPEPKRVDFWKYWVFDYSEWDWHTFDFRRDLVYANAKMDVVNATNPDLNAFQKHGGKLLIYQGWADPVVPPRASIQYVESVYADMGHARADKFVRLFLVPGMGHCGGGYGPLPAGNEFDPGAATTAQLRDPDQSFLAALERWVERGITPHRIVASQVLASGVRRTRPICAYPQVAKWIGKGSTDDAPNFLCSTK